VDSRDFISTQEIIAEATEYLNDSNFSHGIGKSLYELMVHRSIESLALSTFFQKVTKDIFNWNKCGDGTIPIPQNLFNVRELYLFNSSCDGGRSCQEVTKEIPSDTTFQYEAVISPVAEDPTIETIVVNGVNYTLNFLIVHNDPSIPAILQAMLNALGFGSIFTVSVGGGLKINVSCTADIMNKFVVNYHAGKQDFPFTQFSGCTTTVTTVECTDGAGDGNGECNECCSCKSCWTSFVEAHWKRTFNKFGSTGIKTAKITSSNLDPVYMRRVNVPGNLYYFGMQDGIIAMSDNAKSFKNMRIVANGFGSDNNELPIIPRALRQVTIDMITMSACKKLMLVYPEYKSMYQVYYTALYGDNTVQNPGSYLRAERYVKSLNTKQRNDLFEYFGNIDIK